MAIALVSAQGRGFTGFPSSPQSFSIDAGAAADRGIFVATWILSGDVNQITGVTYGGVALSSQTRLDTNTNDWWQFWYLTGASVPSGSNTLEFTWTTTGAISQLAVAAITYSGVGAFAGYTGAAVGSGTTNPTVTVTSTSGDTVVGMFGNESTGEVGTAGSGVTEQYDARPTTPGTPNIRFYIGDKTASGTSTVVDYTTSGTSYAHKFGFALTPASGGSSNGAAAYYFSQQM